MNKIYDMNNVPIYPGDVLRSFYMYGPRRKKLYFYYVAILEKGRWYAYPANYWSIPYTGARFLLDQARLDTMEILEGSVVHEDGKEYFFFTQRPKRDN